MPRLVACLVLFGCSALARAEPSADEEDDPKWVRMHRAAAPPRPTPRFKLGYRYFFTNGLGEGRSDYHIVELDYYPVSRILRVGVELQVGIGADAYKSWFVTTGAALGVQYPWRLTPFIEARFSAGLIGGSYMGASLASWVVLPGLDAGVEVYVAGRFLLTVAVGWLHPVYNGIDLAWVRAHPGIAPEQIRFDNDTVTAKIGFGF